MATEGKAGVDRPGTAPINAHRTPGQATGKQAREMQDELERSLNESTAVADKLRQASSGKP